MGTKTAKLPVECPACGKSFGTAIRGANAKCTGTKDKPCGRTIYIRLDGSYGDRPAPDQPKDPPAGTATADNGEHDDDTSGNDPPAPPAPTTTEVPRYGYDDKSKPAAATTRPPAMRNAGREMPKKPRMKEPAKSDVTSTAKA